MPLTTGQYKTVLQEQNRDYYNRKTWENLLSQNQQSAIAAENQLVKDYTQASTAAYTSYLQNRANIESSALFGESKQKMLSENQLNLEEAYNTYRQNLAQNEQALQKSYQENVSAVNEALAERAENFVAYENAAYDYTKYLFEKAPQLATDPRFANYFTQDAIWDETANEGKGDWERDEEGNIRYGEARLKTVDELYKDFYTYNKELNRYESNEDLADYLDFVENYIGQGERPEGLDDIMSWEDYIRSNNPDLADYMFAGDPYNYTEEGTVAGSFRTLTGRKSTDRDWSYAERITGVKAKYIQEQFSKYKDKFTDIVNTTNDTAIDRTTQIKNLSNSFVDMAKDLGIDKDLEQDLNMSLDSFVDNITNLEAQGVTKGKATGEFLGWLGASIGGGAAVGAGVGTWALPGVGTAIGAVAGALMGVVAGAMKASDAADKNDATNKRVNAAAQETFNNLLVAMTKYAELKKTQATTSSTDFKNRGRLY